jgi:glyoxylase-like metal-dependent hydrolase (beta-lactamase superfamily II)
VVAATYPVKSFGSDVSVVLGPVNGVLIRQGGKTLAIYGDPREAPGKAEKVLFTEGRRDVVWAGRGLVSGGAEAIVPAGDQAMFTGAAEFWEQFQTARFHDYKNQSSKVLAEPFQHVTAVKDGDTIRWGNRKIEVLDTPGYTRGAVSYAFEAGGKRIVCSGDLIYGDGQILDLYSLQDAIAGAKEDGYHGWASRAGDVVASLRKIAARNPDILIPARGPAIENPREAIDKLIGRLQAVFASHFEIDALRFYRGDDKIRLMQSRVLGSKQVDWMPMAETIHLQLPDWIVAIQNSRVILSSSGAAFLVDCGSAKIEQVKKLQQEGRFKKLEGIYVTHYHDDHTNRVQAAAEEFKCPVHICREMKDIIEHPAAYRMPCLTTNPIRPTVMEEGQKVRWHEFEFTYFYFPGQTLYHGGLLVKKDGGESIFFVGDSFTPSGIDDYCLTNRNFLPPEKGFVYCLNVLKRVKPDLLINQHVAPTFRFSDAQLDRMMANLEARAGLLRDLFPWDDPMFGVDEQWARFYPYASEVKAGRKLDLKVMVTNHSASVQEFSITPNLPAGWKAARRVFKVSIAAREEGSVSIPVSVPLNENGLRIVTAGVAYGPWDLREWTEAMVAVR